MQDCCRQHADEEHNQIRRSKMRIQLHGRARIFDDHTRLLQSDEGNEKPDACRNTVLRLGLIALKISSRNPTSDKIKNSTPETNTTPSATCQPLEKPAAAAAGSAEKTKKKFSPIPGACAIG